MWDNARGKEESDIGSPRPKDKGLVGPRARRWARGAIGRERGARDAPISDRRYFKASTPTRPNRTMPPAHELDAR